MKTLIITVALLVTGLTYSQDRVKWEDNIKNKENAEYVNEVAFNLHKDVKEVTQAEFNTRYSIETINEQRDSKRVKENNKDTQKSISMFANLIKTLK